MQYSLAHATTCCRHMHYNKPIAFAEGDGIPPWVLGVAVAIVVIILMAALIIVSIFCYRIKYSKQLCTIFG